MTLDRQIREYYRSRTLDEARAREILRETRSSARASRPRLTRGVILFAGAAAVACVLAWSWSVGFTRDLATEVVVNHLKKIEMQVTTPHYEVLQAHLSHLSFPLVPTRPDLIAGYELVGGRYCSLAGSPAAQLCLRRLGDGRLATLYVTRMGARALGVRPGFTTRHGVQVEMWTENGMVYGLAVDDRSAP
jgi:anti-sigma factor RsiW